jgi:F-type H+-transporting ATPase subunit delta
MKNFRAARRYAAGFLAAADDIGAVDAVARDCGLLTQVLRDAPGFRLLVASPIVTPAKKTAVFRELFDQRVHAATMTFLRLLAAKGREEILPEVLEQVAVLHDERRGIITVDVAVAVEPTPEQQTALRAELERTTGRTVRLRIALDPRIRGGLVVKIGDTVLDASVRRQLELLRERLAAGGPLTNHV